MQQSISLVTLGVADYRRSKAFYEALGWQVAMDIQETAFFQANGVVLVLWARDQLAGDTGVALLSRLPLSDVTRIDLPWHECPWRPRLAMAATVAGIRVFNAHVDPHAATGDQLAQLEVIAEQAGRVSGPTLIMGDFNTLSREKCLQTRTFLESRGYTTPLPMGTATSSSHRLHHATVLLLPSTISKTSSSAARNANWSRRAWPEQRTATHLNRSSVAKPKSDATILAPADQGRSIRSVAE